MPPLVLLLTHAADHTTVDWVADALRQRGAQPLRVDTDRFPLDWQLGLRQSPDEEAGFLRLHGQTHALEAVQAVWLRQLQPPALGDAVDPRFQASCLQECRHVLRALWDRLERARRDEAIRDTSLAVPEFDWGGIIREETELRDAVEAKYAANPLGVSTGPS